MGAAAIIERAIDIAKEDLKEGPKRSPFGAWLMISTAYGCLRDSRFSGNISLFDQVKYIKELSGLANQMKPPSKT